MWIASSTPTPRPSPPNRPATAALALALLAAAPAPASAQLTVYDPTNHVENALQAARQLQSLTHEAQGLINQARSLAASPYSHLAATSETLKAIGDLAHSVRGVAAEVAALEDQFADLYPTAVEGLDPRQALDQAEGRARLAAATAQDLARTAAELERLSAARQGRLHGALSASQAAGGQTAAIQSSNQLLAVLAEDLGSLRALLGAQSRLLAESGARAAADRAAAAERRRQYYGRPGSAPAAPAFDPFPNARN